MGFFHEGGLIVGSTNQYKIKTAGNAKAIDFYSGLKLDGPLNKERVKWSDRVKKEEKGKQEIRPHLLSQINIFCIDGEVSDVFSLNDWEKTILKEVDPDYEISDDENAPKPDPDPVDEKPEKGKGKKK